jgi:cystathionine beta-lyase/cystathionine gamma-synthase
MSHGLKELGLQTLVLHEGDGLNETHAVSPPIWQTTTFTAESPAQLQELGVSVHPSEFYTRYGNPTHRQTEAIIAALEGGEAALVTSSGMGAIFSAVMTGLENGDHVVAQTTHYSATGKLMRDLLPRWGIECSLVDQTKLEAFAQAVRPNTKLIYIESPSNPLLKLTDIQGVAELAQSRKIRTVIDNTFASPVNQQPLKLGIDVVVHSATKYLGGHHDLTAGVIVGSSAYIAEVWDFSLVAGSILSPFDSWLLLRGLKTLGLRVERQNSNAIALARFLESHPKVERVNYPGLESHPQHQLAQRQMKGFGGVMSVLLKGDQGAAQSLISSLKLAKCAVSLGGADTLIVHAATMWGHQHTVEQRRAAGIGDGLVRISVGIEDERDLIADFGQALDT